jgi:hypothetical protein
MMVLGETHIKKKKEKKQEQNIVRSDKVNGHQ